MISVVITFCKLDQLFLERCMSSVRWQLTSGDELIVVSDGGTVVTPHVDPDGFGIRHEFLMTAGMESKPIGVSQARNLGWRTAKNEWVKFLDVDDLLAPFALDALKRAASTVARPIDVLAGGQHIVHNGRYKGLRRTSPETINRIGEVNPLLVSFSMIRRAALEEVRGFDTGIHFEEDWDLWLRLRKAGGRVGLFSDPVCYYTIDDERRAETEKVRSRLVDGIDVREFLAREHGITPIR